MAPSLTASAPPLHCQEMVGGLDGRFLEKAEGSPTSIRASLLDVSTPRYASCSPFRERPENEPPMAFVPTGKAEEPKKVQPESARQHART